MIRLPATKRVLSKAWADRGVTTAIKWEVLSIPPAARVRITFEQAAAPGQGLWVAATGGLLLDEVTFEQVLLWHGRGPDSVQIQLLPGDGLLHFYNIWHDAKAYENAGSQSYASAMLQEPVPSGFRYRCNDIGFNESFDRLVFRIEPEA